MRSLRYMTAGLLLATSLACSLVEERDGGRMTSIIIVKENPQTRSVTPDEGLVHDLNLFVFDSRGMLEDKAWTGSDNPEGLGDSPVWNTRLLEGESYSIYACANFGTEMDISDEEELLDYRLYLPAPDHLEKGIPMAGMVLDLRADGQPVTLHLERMMAKVNIRVDRSRLDEDVHFEIRNLEVGGCPRSAFPFRRNHIREPFDFFIEGYDRNREETSLLNRSDGNGMSGQLSLYLFENMQGTLLPGNTSEEKKYFSEDAPERKTCSYVEIRSEYTSDSLYTRPGSHLVYRFYPGNDPSNFDIMRNTCYDITVIPAGDGLSGVEWRMDKSGLDPFIRQLDLSYKSLRMNYEGEEVKLEAITVPEGVQPEALCWKSSDEKVATVSRDGTVRAVSEGGCTLYCCADDPHHEKDSCKVSVAFSPYRMRVLPGNFIRCRKGDEVRIRCDFFPPDASFNIGEEELEFDRKRGIYDYEIGEDGKSVRLFTKKRGTGLLYMETGSPIHQAELIVLVVN